MVEWNMANPDGPWAGYRGRVVPAKKNTSIPFKSLTKPKADSSYLSEKARLAIGITTLFTIAIAALGFVGYALNNAHITP